MSSAPWRNRVPYDGKENTKSDPDFLQSYPELSGMKSIVRGYIVTLDESPQRRFHFLVNPSVVSTSYEIANQLDMTNLANIADVDLASLNDGLLTMSFQILLDRTYETWKGNQQYRGGVLHDVLALEQVLGVPPGTSLGTAAGTFEFLAEKMPFIPQFAKAAQVQRDKAVQDYLVQGVLVKKYLRVLFGSKYALSFDGYVNSLSIEYTHFTHEMVPTRAGVVLNFTSFGTSSNSMSGPTDASVEPYNPSQGASPTPFRKVPQ